MHDEKHNDGTIAITFQVEGPSQGTYVGRKKDGTLVVSKGIVRPPLIDMASGEVEEESAVVQAAFGRKILDAPEGEFYKLKEVGRERCNLAYQTILFSAKNPAKTIRHDTERVEALTAFDLMSRDGAEKVKHGVPPAMLIEDIAPWDLVRRYKASGVRATVYGSYLVSDGYDADEGNYAVNSAFAAAGWDFTEEWEYSHFKLLPHSALELLDMTEYSSVEQMIGHWFLIHRDPALPDGTSLYPARFEGVVSFAGDINAKHGVVLHPRDPYWNAAGGDFDGDSAAVYVPTKSLLPRGPIPRDDYKLNGVKFASTEVGEQMCEAAGNTVTELLGPVILAGMRLIERAQDTDDVRGLAATVAQASVQAKKHAVDIEATREGAQFLYSLVRDNNVGGTKPYLTDYFNELNNASGLTGKIREWQALMQAIERGTWDDGTDIEKALVHRVRVINQLFSDVRYFQKKVTDRLPQTIINAALLEVPSRAAEGMKDLTHRYRQKAMLIGEVERNMVESGEDSSEYRKHIAGELATMREQFRMVCIVGNIDGHQVEPRIAQIAMVAFGPQKLAARIVPASIFEALGSSTKRLILNLCDHNWKNGEYQIKDLKPIPSAVNDLLAFSVDHTKCKLEIISQAKRSTRVVLTTC